MTAIAKKSDCRSSCLSEFYPILSYPILSYPILSYPMEGKIKLADERLFWCLKERSVTND
ncbi:hypothetical protein Runsl_0682 [Runella slithyformis DSM 19594]|uniref:Uncharacterized protein n=1 Tax=Runella slithyformis (strain ATCC 29530 / DSM 19594 / LMG 11500 / NCIMB 11436 / LSU 4) TaxID=761193 RepID=A0A7U3ZH87_RUNSL|nr:hypothetical protein Runsl_0682 [Runella slithyformis DSM 19594]